MYNIYDMDLKITNTAIPGEALIIAIFEYAKVCRETMSEENRNRWDALNASIAEDWRGFFKGLAGKQ